MIRSANNRWTPVDSGAAWWANVGLSLSSDLHSLQKQLECHSCSDNYLSVRCSVIPCCWSGWHSSVFHGVRCVGNSDTRRQPRRVWWILPSKCRLASAGGMRAVHNVNWHLSTVCELPDKSKGANGALRSDAQIADSEVGLLGRGSDGRTAQRFFCTLRSPGSLLCYVIKGKQCRVPSIWQHVGLSQPPGGRNYTSSWGVIYCSTGGSAPWPSRQLAPCNNLHHLFVIYLLFLLWFYVEVTEW